MRCPAGRHSSPAVCGNASPSPERLPRTHASCFSTSPFGALDALTRETLQQDLITMCRNEARHVTTVMITNNVEEAILLSDRIFPLLPGPPATLGSPIAVDLAHPRSASRLAHDEQAMHVRAHVVATLTASLRKPKTSVHPAANLAAPGTLAEAIE